jgi:hypothetical protein
LFFSHIDICACAFAIFHTPPRLRCHDARRPPAHAAKPVLRQPFD